MATRPTTRAPRPASIPAVNVAVFNVVEILKRSKNPLKTADIYEELVAQGYKFTFKEAKKVLGIRFYKMLGVQPLGGGLFKAK